MSKNRHQSQSPSPSPDASPSPVHRPSYGKQEEDDIPSSPASSASEPGTPQREGSRESFKYGNDNSHLNSKRVEFTNKKYDVTYTRSPVEPERHMPVTSKHKHAIMKYTEKQMFVDPYEEFGSREYRYNEEEKTQFYEFTNKIVNSGQLKGLPKYMKQRPYTYGDYIDEIDQESNGQNTVKDIPTDLFVSRLNKYPHEIWTNPYLFITGKFYNMLKWHHYTREVEIGLLGMMALDMHERNVYQKDYIIMRCNKAGLALVMEEVVSEQVGVPEYIHCTFRFTEMKTEQHLKDVQMNKGKHEEFTNIEWDTLTSLIEDRLIANAILVPVYNMKFMLAKSKRDADKDNVHKKHANKTQDVEQTKEIPHEKRVEYEKNDKFVLGSIFYTV